MIGFANLGDVDTHLMAYERSVAMISQQNDGALLNPVAKSMLVFFVKGLFSNLQYAYAQFPCVALSGCQIFEPFWEAVSRLEYTGFKVMALTCDGLAANRRFFGLHNPGSKKMTYKVKNPYAAEDRDIYFFIDPPNLLKCVRNGWANQKRRLWVITIFLTFNF